MTTSRKCSAIILLAGCLLGLSIAQTAAHMAEKATEKNAPALQALLASTTSSQPNIAHMNGTARGLDISNTTGDEVIEWSATLLSHLNMTMSQTQVLDLRINDIDPSWGDDYELHVVSDKPALLFIERVIKAKEVGAGATSWSGNFTVEALFLGQASIFVELRRPHHEPERSKQQMDVIITRAMGLLDDIYKMSVGTLVLILYINFGAILDLYALKRIILRPVGPAIGFIGQFLCMPILSFLIGYYVFPDLIELRLGLLFTGSTPGGGFSNIFTVVLNGNINLSVTMTAFSNLAAFGMMPLWIFSLGSLILQDGNFAIPYETIATMSFSLLVPLSVGIALQKYAPRWTSRITKHLQPISFALILFVMGFAFTINSYMFTMLSWKIIVACSALPWIGYGIGYVLGLICRQSPTDALTIAIETGIQNTGIAIFMLNFTLPQPQADITSAIPVTNFLLTPVPLMVLYLIRKLCCRPAIEELDQDDPTKEPAEYELAMLEKGEKAHKQTED